MRRTVSMVLVVAALWPVLWGVDPAHAGGHCPNIRGAANPLDPTHVIRTFEDMDGCAVPLRTGIGHIPWQKNVYFGYEHIVMRAREGRTEHEVGAMAMDRWQQALLEAGAALGKDYECHSYQYKVGTQKRTMLVFVDYKDFRGYAYKGITSAYWVSGYQHCPLTTNGD